MTAPDPSQGTVFYFIRHGETRWNVENILQGQHDAPLTPRGVEQAKQLAQQYQPLNFAAIYSSDLGRAQATSHIIAQSHNLPVQTTALLRERRLGRYEGRKAKETITELQEKIHTAQKLTTTERMQYRLAPDIETDQQIVNRVIRFIDSVLPSHPNQSILVTTHEGVIRTLLINLGFASHNELPRGSIDNLGYVIIQKVGGQFKILETHGVHKQQTTQLVDDL